MEKELTFSFGKIAIVGAAGGLGATMAFHVGMSGIAKELVLMDPMKNVLNTHEIDLRECFVGETPTKVTQGEWKEASGADVIIMAAAKSGRQVKSRNEYLFSNLELVRETAAKIRNNAPDAFVVSATAPVDVFVMVFLEELKCPRNKVMGFCINDSQRFKWALGQAMDIDPKRTFGLVLGEHGESQVPIFSSVQVDFGPHEVKEKERAMAYQYIKSWYPIWQSQDAHRTTTWSSAVGMLHNLRSLADLPNPMPLMGSVLLEGEYGLKDVALGVPLTPGPNSWEKVVELPLTDEESKDLKASGDRVKELYAQTMS
ncbi:MAG: hypothetical protein LBF41_03940 [Deltaproteobacteria bacterium]|jgi:malate/lactate dehydrogenase|nr:hypothetical protein [Deltaproteobacteria bacterium]